MVGSRTPARGWRTIPPVPGGQVYLTPDNRFDPGLYCLVIELHDPEHIAMVSDGHTIHP